MATSETQELALPLDEHRPEWDGAGFPRWLRVRVATHVVSERSAGTSLAALSAHNVLDPSPPRGVPLYHGSQLPGEPCAHLITKIMSTRSTPKGRLYVLRAPTRHQTQRSPA
jgi:hypothetical protein